MRKKYEYIAEKEQKMLLIGRQIANMHIAENDIVYLHGNLGTGKTTLTKGIIHGLGFRGAVKSPTYNLVETYLIKNMLTVQHFDFYRLSDSEELEWIGIRDYFDHQHITLIEWPDKGLGFIPPATKNIQIEYLKKRRQKNNN